MGELILNKARELFFSYGLKSVSMDDLAKLSGISKKTLYQYFSDKQELVDHIVQDLIECNGGQVKEVQCSAKDAIEEVLQQSNKPFFKWASINRAFFFELQRSFPQVWQKLEHYKLYTFLPAIQQNIKRGMEEGLYRNDLNSSFIADYRLQQLALALQPDAFSRHAMDMTQLVNELTSLYLHGITTEKGKNKLTKYCKERNENNSAK